MHYLTKRIREKFPQWNVAPITEDDLWNYCEENKIDFEMLPFAAKGYFGKKTSKQRKPRRRPYFLAIDSRLTIELLEVLAHEVGHHACGHEPLPGCDPLRFTRGNVSTQNKREHEANMFMLCALIPLPLMHDLRYTDPDDVPEEYRMIMSRRLALFKEIDAKPEVATKDEYR